MKTVFVTTPTNDCANHVRAWRSFAEAERVVMHAKGIRDDAIIVRAVIDHKPDLIFYIGACRGLYHIRTQALRTMRGHAPHIHLCSDAADSPWHAVLRGYKLKECFSLQVSLDGAKPPAIDLAGLTPVDPEPFRVDVGKRDIRCGFSGSCGRSNNRAEALRALEWFAGLKIRERQYSGGYADHASFLRRCKLLINISWTGSGLIHHIKGRVLEAGWAGCALLESEGSPIAGWFSPESFFTWRTPQDAADIIRHASDKEIAEKADSLSFEVRAKYSPRQIYGNMLEALDVDHPYALPAA